MNPAQRGTGKGKILLKPKQKRESKGVSENYISEAHKCF
jgi:hypothetical protein